MLIPEKIKDLGTGKTFNKGEELFAAEDIANGFYYILSGEIRLYKMDADGREIDVSRLGKQEFLGEVILFAADKFPVYAQASTNVSVIFFSKNTVLNAIDRDSSISKFFLKLLASKCLNLVNRIESLVFKTVRQKLIRYLLSQCTKDGNCTIRLTLTKTALAKHLGTISETLSRNLKQLQEEGLIKVIGNQIRILNCTSLKEELF